MTFRFEYKFHNKFSIRDNAGFMITIDDEFDNIEYCQLDFMGRIKHNVYYEVSIDSKEKIKKVIEDNKNIFNLNSYFYNEGNYNDIEQMFYFELNNLNRKVEGTNIFPDYEKDFEIVQILLNVFNQISNILLNDKIILKLNSFKKI